MLPNKTTLDNGLRIVTVEIPQARSVTCSFYIAAGSRHESEDIQGVSHFIEHMLFKGTARRPTPKDVSEAIEGIGGIFNAEAGKEATVYWDKVAKRHWPTAMEVLTDLLLNSLFSQQEIEKERRVIVEELNMLVDSPGEWVHVLVDEAVWGDDPLGRDPGGTKESVSTITREQMLDYFHAYYAPANSVLAVAGAITHGEVVDHAARLLRDWRPGTSLEWKPTRADHASPNIKMKTKRTEQAHVCLAVPGISYVHPDRFALDLLNVVLGEGMSSRLFLEIRERQGLAYDVHSYVDHFRDTGSVVIYAGVDPKRIDQTIGGIIQEVMKLKADIPEDELQRAKEFSNGRLLLRLEDSRSIAAWIGGQELLLGEVMDADEVIANIDAVTTADVSRMARSLYEPGRLNLALIGPFTSEERFRRLLRAM